MAFRMTRQLPSFKGVVAGSTATLDVPLGWTYHSFLITYSSVTLAELNEIRLLVDGRTVQRYKGGSARLDTINQYSGMSAANGVIRLEQDRYSLITRDAIELSALGTGAQGNDIGPQPEQVTIEVDIDSAAASPVLSASAIRSASTPVGRILELREFGYNPSASGEFQISDLPLGDGWPINKLYFFSSDINSVQVERDDRTIFKRKPAENDLVQSDGIRTPQAGLYVVDPSEIGYGSDDIVTEGVQDFRITLDMAAAGSLPVVVEYLKTYTRQ